MENTMLKEEWEDIMPEAFQFYSGEVNRIDTLIQSMKQQDKKRAIDLLTSYVRFITFLFEGDDEYPGPYINPLSMQKQMTYEQYLKFIVKERFSRTDICETLQRMENYGKPKYFAKDRKFLGLTLRDWLTRADSGQEATSSVRSPKQVRQ